MKKVMDSLKGIKPAFRDRRGAIFDILDETIRHVGIIDSRPGSSRGNHYHKKATQWTYVISGKIRIYLRDAKDGKAKVKVVQLNEGEIIKLPPYTIHTIETVKKSKMLILTDVPRINNGYEYDTFRVKIA